MIVKGFDMGENPKTYGGGYRIGLQEALTVVDKVKYDRFKIIEGEVFVSVDEIIAQIQELDTFVITKEQGAQNDKEEMAN